MIEIEAYCQECGDDLEFEIEYTYLCVKVKVEACESCKKDSFYEGMEAAEK